MFKVTLKTVAIASASLLMLPTLQAGQPASAAEPSADANNSEVIQQIEQNILKESKKSIEGAQNLNVWRSLSPADKTALADALKDPRLDEAIESAVAGEKSKLADINESLDFKETPPSPGVATFAVGTNSAVQSNTLTYFKLNLTTLRTHTKYEVSRGGTAYKMSSCYNSHTNILPLRSVSAKNEMWGPKNHLSCQTNWTINYGIPKVPAGSYSIQQGLTVAGKGVVNRWCTNGF